MGKNGTGLRVGICGAGVGGLCAATALVQAGHVVEVFEQASRFGRVGADVNLTPNAVHALKGLGLWDAMKATGAFPTHRISRVGETGEETSRLPLSSAAEERYGAPQLTLHRADFLAMLTDALGDGHVHFGAKVTGVDQTPEQATILFADGSRRDFDVVVGADGIHSPVRHALFGPDDPKFTGLVSHRGVFPREKAGDLPDLDAFTKWWGATPDYQIVTFPLTRGEEIFVFSTTPRTDWTEEGWTIPGDLAALRHAYADFHPNAQALLKALPSVTSSALHVRAPLARWSVGRVIVMGDAAHPMVPFMAQGACMAIEDAVVLTRCLDAAGPDGIEAALRDFEAVRKPRTTQIQESSLANEWLKNQTNADWVYAYHAWETDLRPAA
ncbi:FAD-dependent monooxygenase [Amorphus orientalis]|uniref:Salicylate hydroxylase n=1 Tax=Amorphus orientalis TaxID=649198 RepID=A0AAE3VML0_9HYPH|nr:FAD-dependent monooxygenase [Amorphus orientalis]MDQ0314515.1 salicylate hydroxylase [Amorphus orientalis]